METIKTQKRGMLTQRIKEKSMELLGYEISQKELRLMVYLNYVMTNNQKLDYSKIDGHEDKIIQKWTKFKLVGGTIEKLTVTKYFWDIISEIVWLGYVDIEN